ncbi:MAG TPA: hypothetical protein VMT10_01175 [Solirubrobacteraceae bacterium]|nr:hypothetical protein [Solirubrobacteraceae bacterium]
MPYGKPPHSTPPTGASIISFEDRLRSRRAAKAHAAVARHAATGLAVRARVAAVTDTCWCCRQKVRAIVGVLVEPEHTPDGSGFLPLEAVDEALLRALDRTTLARRGIGELRHRDSPGIEGGYIANGCIECDALIGRFHLEDLLTEHRNAGGSPGQLDVGIAVQLELRPAARSAGRSALG